MKKNNSVQIKIFSQYIYRFIYVRSNLASDDTLEYCNLESVIDVGQGIIIGPGKFVKKNKRRALNKRRASEF